MPPQKRGKRPSASGDDDGNRNAQEDGEPFSEKSGRLQKPEFDEADNTKASKRRENVANIFLPKFRTFLSAMLQIIQLKYVHFSILRTHTVRPFPFSGSE